MVMVGGGSSGPPPLSRLPGPREWLGGPKNSCGGRRRKGNCAGIPAAPASFNPAAGTGTVALPVPGAWVPAVVPGGGARCWGPPPGCCWGERWHLGSPWGSPGWWGQAGAPSPVINGELCTGDPRGCDLPPPPLGAGGCYGVRAARGGAGGAPCLAVCPHKGSLCGSPAARISHRHGHERSGAEPAGRGPALSPPQDPPGPTPVRGGPLHLPVPPLSLRFLVWSLGLPVETP